MRRMFATLALWGAACSGSDRAPATSTGAAPSPEITIAPAPSAAPAAEAPAPEDAHAAAHDGEPITCTHKASSEAVQGILSCEDACRRRNGNCFYGKACLTQCEAGWGSWSPKTRRDFFRCVACDPLCYSRLEDCMASPPEPR